MSANNKKKQKNSAASDMSTRKKLRGKKSPKECNHGILEGEPYYPVKRVIRCKKQKGIQMKLVEWEPCSLCEKTWQPQWVTEENTTN
ncbi:hypothetical protein G5714_009019 [Onychostoma macrolepis]|uniref:Chromo domain-containing protein n=1 Tax=Onychostoma macrolepis TaxID=369639 RepID=A0A7J6CQZ5_9TELE|nr:hypothetical protein G5714_009019 [Onychostoma macrolepis]